MARSTRSAPLFSTFSPSQKASLSRRAGLSSKTKEFTPKQPGSQTKQMGSIEGPAKVLGCVKWFDVKKGYGFIRSEAVGDVDIFVHQRDIHADGVRILLPGEKVEFQLEREADGRYRALYVTGPNGSFVYGAENVNKIRTVGGRARHEEEHPVPFWYGPPANTPIISEEPRHPMPFVPVPQAQNFPYWNPLPPATPPLTSFHPQSWGASMGSIAMVPPYSDYVPYVVRPPPMVVEDASSPLPPFAPPTSRKPTVPSQASIELTAAQLRSLELERDSEAKSMLMTPQSHRGSRSGSRRTSPVRSKIEPSDSPSEASSQQRPRRISSNGIKAILSGIERNQNPKTDSITGSWRRSSVPTTLDVSPSPTSSETSTNASPTTSVTSSNSTPSGVTTTPESVHLDSSPISQSSSGSTTSSSPASLSSSPVLSVAQIGQGERGKVLALPLKASERGVYLKKGKHGQKRWEKKLKSAQDTVKENPESTVWMLNDGVFSLGDDARILREMGFTHIVWIPE